ncbi:hypothetical protein NIES80_24480 [Dolichospermum planctonicum]|jgi:hypothetical protein|uniref:Uncharacterized protein n=1 Tax=Dolichospermum planctonicum TaxID=136072 RepID=A0A480ACB3_9CYAN|nr:hypothetical protein NIES80_24480 [Dolichospermum planctonicum]
MFFIKLAGSNHTNGGCKQLPIVMAQTLAHDDLPY